MKLVLGHVSFPEKIAERRMCCFLFQEKVINLLKNRRSPVLLEVINSCNIKANNRTLSVVVEFQVVPNSYAVKVPPKLDHEEEDPLPQTPWLEVLVCNCNCSRYPSSANVIVEGMDPATQESCQSSTDSTDVSEEEEGSTLHVHDQLGGETQIDEETAQFTEYFALKGSSYHEDCQKTLHKCKQLQLQNKNIDLRVTPEPNNIRDKNAVIVEACIDNDWDRIGYIPKEKLRKVVVGIRNNEIQKVAFKFIGFMFIPDLNDWLYNPRVLISKVGHWLPTDASYKYNDLID